jgi:hypothetical protein
VAAGISDLTRPGARGNKRLAHHPAHHSGCDACRHRTARQQCAGPTVRCCRCLCTLSDACALKFHAWLQSLPHVGELDQRCVSAYLLAAAAARSSAARSWCCPLCELQVRQLARLRIGRQLPLPRQPRYLYTISSQQSYGLGPLQVFDMGFPTCTPSIRGRHPYHNRALSPVGDFKSGIYIYRAADRRPDGVFVFLADTLKLSAIQGSAVVVQGCGGALVNWRSQNRSGGALGVAQPQEVLKHQTDARLAQARSPLSLCAVPSTIRPHECTIGYVPPPGNKRPIVAAGRPGLNGRCPAPARGYEVPDGRRRALLLEEGSEYGETMLKTQDLRGERACAFVGAHRNLK